MESCSPQTKHIYWLFLFNLLTNRWISFSVFRHRTGRSLFVRTCFFLPTGDSNKTSVVGSTYSLTTTTSNDEITKKKVLIFWLHPIGVWTNHWYFISENWLSNFFQNDEWREQNIHTNERWNTSHGKMWCSLRNSVL